MTSEPRNVSGSLDDALLSSLLLFACFAAWAYGPVLLVWGMG